MKAHFYPPGNSTWHPLDGWNSPGISALHLGFWQPRVKMSVQPSQTKDWSEVIPRNWPVLQSCLHRYWGRTGNWYQGTFSERKLVKRRKNILLGGMLHSSGALEFEIKCSDRFDFSFLSRHLFHRICNKLAPAGLTQVMSCFLLWLILNVFRFWFSEIPRQFLENPQALWTHTSTKAEALSISQKQALKH